MKDFLLSRANRSPGRRETATVALTEERGDTFFDALASETTRRLFQALHERSSTPTELAEEFDTSRQNIHYHIEKLEAADLIEPIDTVYSSRGREMHVYAPTHEAVVLVSGGESTVDRVRSVLSRFLGGLTVLLLASLVLQAAVVGLPELGHPSEGAPTGGAAGGGNGAELTGGTTPTPTTSVAMSTDATRGADAASPTGEARSTETSAGGSDGAAATATAGQSTARATERTVSGGTGAGGTAPDTAGGSAGTATGTGAEDAAATYAAAGATQTPISTATATGPTKSRGTGSPIVYFFAGGVFALVVTAAWQYRR